MYRFISVVFALLLFSALGHASLGSYGVDDKHQQNTWRIFQAQPFTPSGAPTTFEDGIIRVTDFSPLPKDGKVIPPAEMLSSLFGSGALNPRPPIIDPPPRNNIEISDETAPHFPNGGYGGDNIELVVDPAELIESRFPEFGSAGESHWYGVISPNNEVFWFHL